MEKILNNIYVYHYLICIPQVLLIGIGFAIVTLGFLIMGEATKNIIIRLHTLHG